jgi:hypothetical protein
VLPKPIACKNRQIIIQTLMILLSQKCEHRYNFLYRLIHDYVGVDMRSLLAFLFALSYFHPIFADTSTNLEDEIILPASPPQKVLRCYQTNFGYQHDRGFYLSATLGPQWNHSISNPDAKAFRFGGKLGLGWYVANGVALYGAGWGNFLEQATLIAGGPGVTFLFNGPNIGLDLSLGVGRAFRAIKKEGYEDFAETVLAANLSLAKFWWLSGSTSLGISLMSGIHGLTVTTGKFSSVGWNVGLGLSFLLG